MADTSMDQGRQIRSTVRKDGVVELSLLTVATPDPKPEEVIVRMEASPINPSDQGLLFGGADMSTAKASGNPENPVVTAAIPAAAMKGLAGRVDQSLPVGNEGAGVVVRAGASPAAQALMGKTVAILGGGMYTQYRCIKAVQCLVLPPGTTPAEGASCFVNPLTALGMVATMRAEGHKALVHTAAAYARMRNRLGTLVCTSSIGPGATNMVTGAALATICRFSLRKPRDRRMPANSSPEQPTSDIMSGTMMKPPPSTEPGGRGSVGMRGRQKTRSRMVSASRSSMSMRTQRSPQMRKPAMR